MYHQLTWSIIMPSKSEAQKRLMAAASHDPKFAKKVGIDPKVAKEFNEKDKGSKKKLPEHVEKSKAKPSKETYTTTSTLAGPKGFKDL
ncbi:hypothetical protein ST201phi2-1p383 [Pseudomonas phage 201phi2-1]|uniref:Uncharacterized protein n=1 Tax=Pseudomonas phage 201phi2-1 TaxID=198110 RepID=B3FJP3_BP201|nr:hypothetical protein ST201phi2-1p383 [Pseudomonas phage 201phi2-1]ABY63208.1 hypothetical protein 201phi2-1p383 [Pseudomonas phage 201phi2-1]